MSSEENKKTLVQPGYSLAPLLHFLSQPPAFQGFHPQNEEWITTFISLDFFFFCQTLFKKLKVLVCYVGREKRKESAEGDDPLSVIIANEETGKLWAGENTQA